MKSALKPEAAAERIEAGATILVGGCMGVGSPHRLIDALLRRGTGDLTVVCNDPLTADRRVDLIVTDLAVIESTDAGLVLRERAPDTSVEEIRAATAASLIVEADVPVMALSPWSARANAT